jgi:hypothetical protein
MTGARMTHAFGEHDARAFAWPAVGTMPEPLRTPLWVIRTLADALAAEELPSAELQRHVARQIARTAAELEASLSD